jgi:hypothetical protein
LTPNTLNGMCGRGQNDQKAENNLYTQEFLSRGYCRRIMAHKCRARSPSRGCLIGQAAPSRSQLASASWAIGQPGHLVRADTPARPDSVRIGGRVEILRDHADDESSICGTDGRTERRISSSSPRSCSNGWRRSRRAGGSICSCIYACRARDRRGRHASSRASPTHRWPAVERSEPWYDDVMAPRRRA